jgi:pimeloyl-ACP methyl ester carboxylesterase
MIEPTIITYAIPGNDNGGILHIHGNPRSTKMILCCGGYPDDHKPFTPLAKRLASEGDCIVGITCFPGFDLDAYRKSKFDGYKRTGYNFDEVCASIREAVSQLFAHWETKSEVDAVSPKFTIILHDWGVIPGLMFVNRAIDEQYSSHVPNRIVLLDVLTMPHRDYKNIPRQEDVPYSLKPSWYELAVCFTYRFALASSFALLRFVSDIVGLVNVSIMFGIVMLLRLNPTYGFDNHYAIRERARKASSPLSFYRHLVYMCYPYYYMFRCFLRGTGFEDIHLPLDLKSTPILYIYGTEKNVMFHDKISLAIMEREERECRSECRVVAVEGAGHWMYVQKLEVCLEEIKRFIQ